MADADEDALLTSLPHVNGDDGSGDDLEDETVDFRFLSKSHALPKRGTKDFEPLPTDLQANSLAASRQAMHEALAPERFHMPKNHIVGTFEPRTGLTRVTRAKGTGMFLTTGKGTPRGIELLPEEALWMLERGTLDVRWPADWDGEDDVIDSSGGIANDDPGALKRAINGENQDEIEVGIPMSLQGAYAALIGQEVERGGSLTLERYQVYAHLRRSGFVVLRAEGFNDDAIPQPMVPHNKHYQHPPLLHKYGLFGWLLEKINTSSDEHQRTRQQKGPLVPPGLYRSYNQIYRALNIIPTRFSPNPQLPTAPSTPQSQIRPPSVSSTYKLYSPTNIDGTAFRKSAPGPPDFNVCVLSAADTSVPTLPQLTALLASCEPTASLPPSPLAPTTPEQPRIAPPRDSATAFNPARWPGTPSPSTYPFTTTWQAQRAPNHSPGPGPASASASASASPAPSAAASRPNEGSIGHAYARLKSSAHAPSVVLAVVDCGVVSFMRVSEAGFAHEEVFRRFLISIDWIYADAMEMVQGAELANME